MRKAFQQPGFTRLYAGLTTSMFGDSLMLIVLSMWVKTLTGSNGKAGMTFFWMVIPALFAPLYGLYIDRVRRRPLLIGASIASALAVLPLLLVHDAGDVWIVYLVAFLYGISFVVIPAGLNGLLKEMMPESVLVDANASLSTTKESFRLIGPLAGAGLFAVAGGGTVAVLDAASFVIAAVVIATIRVPEVTPVREEQHWWHEMTAGVRHLATEPVLRHILVAVGLTILVVGFSESTIYAITDHFHKPVEFVGVIVTVQGVGAIAGGLTTSRWVRRIGEAGTVAASLAIMAVGMAVIAAAAWLSLVLVAVLFFGYALPMLIIAFNTLLQIRTPNRLMGRASAATEVVLGTPQAVSIALGALLVSIIDYRWIFAIMAAATVSSAGYLVGALRSRLLRPVPPLSETVPA